MGRGHGETQKRGCDLEMQSIRFADADAGADTDADVARAAARFSECGTAPASNYGEAQKRSRGVNLTTNH